jgi:hypothetical protein
MGLPPVVMQHGYVLWQDAEGEKCPKLLCKHAARMLQPAGATLVLSLCLGCLFCAGPGCRNQTWCGGRTTWTRR